MGKNEFECDCDVIHEDRVKLAKKNMIEEETLLLMADLYKALSDSTRIKIVAILGEQEMCVCDIAVLINMTKSAVSHQLKNLREMELVKCRKEGKVVFYSLADEHVKQIFNISYSHVMEEKIEGKN